MGKNIFISHRSVDYERLVTKIISKLNEHNIRPWCSEKCIACGEDYAAAITNAISSCDIVLAIITDEILKNPGQVMNEISLASSFGKTKLAIVETAKPIPVNMLYHFQTNTIKWYELSEEAAYETLFNVLGIIYRKPTLNEDVAATARHMTEAFERNTNSIFDAVTDKGGYSWGMNKSIIQNISGGWQLKNVRVEEWNREPFEFNCSEHIAAYEEFLSSKECEAIMLKGKNHTRWMLTGYDAAYDKLFLSIQKTEWRQTQFVWHHLLCEEAKRKKAITDFFEEEISEYPNSLCLHLVLIDNENNVVASKIKKRKKDDYPGKIAITIGEQLNETDYTSAENFMLQWLRRALREEFGLTEEKIPQYVDEDSARIMTLHLEGDIYNFALICCVRLHSTTKQLYDFYQINRSSEDEFDELFPISTDEIPSILQNSNQLQNAYHPSSFIRLLFAYLYVKKQLPITYE